MDLLAVFLKAVYPPLTVESEVIVITFTTVSALCSDAKSMLLYLFVSSGMFHTPAKGL